MFNKMISVIMPVYNVEKYLSQSINSVLNQTYENFELILVDDKSPDGSPAICDNFAKKDSRIRVIHKQENQGLGYARNTGLDVAQGEYIYFIDSDDFIHNQLLEKAIVATKPETDLVVFGINRFFEDENGNTTKTEQLSPSEFSASKNKEMARVFCLLNEAKVFPFAWNKLYKKSFITKNEARFEKTKLIEDFLFNIYLLEKANNVEIISDCLYNYRKPKHETLASAYSPDFFELCKRKFSLEKAFLDKLQVDESVYQLIYASHVKHIFSVFIKNNSSKSNLTKRDKLVKIKEILSDKISIYVINEYNPSNFIMVFLKLLFKHQCIYLCYYLSILLKFFI